MYFLFSYVNIRMTYNNIHIVCHSVCLSVWYVILEHEADMETSVATIKTPIHISQSKFYFHVQRMKHTIIYTYLSLLMWSIM